jgi:hypothetical protein
VCIDKPWNDPGIAIIYVDQPPFAGSNRNNSAAPDVDAGRFKRITLDQKQPSSRQS